MGKQYKAVFGLNNDVIPGKHPQVTSHVLGLKDTRGKNLRRTP